MPEFDPLSVFLVFIFVIGIVLVIVGLLVVLGKVIKNEWRKK